MGIRMMGQCQAAVAEAVEVCGGLDILLCCSSEGTNLGGSVGAFQGIADRWPNAALVGTVEELAGSIRTQTLVREQFDSNFYGPVNVIKAAIPAMRKKGLGHIMILTGISQQL